MSTDRIKIEDKTIQALFEAAAEVRAQAHAPYSGYRVGAAILDDRGDTWLGCNVENASYPEGSCAETAAIAAMIAGGGRRIQHVVIAGGHGGIEPCSPCGGCRQRISEFADSDTRVWLVAANGTLAPHSVADLLPASFSLIDKR
ncbi:MAG: cytidine deaminase [Pseudomonadota bacterium]